MLINITYSDEIHKPKHSLENIFPSKHRIKDSAADEISAQVSFFSKVKE
jgi:hypothetical protein